MALENLFRYFKKNNKVGIIGLSFNEAEKIIGEELNYSAKNHDYYWKQPRIKHLMAKYGIRFSYLNSLTGFIYFEIL